MKTISLILLFSLTFFSCQKEVSVENGPTNLLATLTTSVVTSITNTTAISGGNISSDGGTAVTDRGVCWSTSANPVITGNHTTDGTGTGTFTSNITGLTASTLYYVRAYATTANGTAYGNEISFTTSATTGALPTVTTSAIGTITQTTASGGGDVLTDGGSTVTARGICWSTSSNPVITNSHTTDGTGLGNFTSSMTALTASTTYYVRAYATNVNGTAYGNEVTFITVAAPGLATVTTDPIGYPGSTSATSGGNVTSDGGSPVTARGVCWSTTTAPVATGSHTTNGAGLGTFVSSVSPLTPATTYYIRAYASNANGTAYGNERTYTTLSTTGPDVYTCGYEANAAGKSVAKYWKNAVATSLTDGTKNADATSIFVDGTDVYVCGWEMVATNINQAVLWKNGVRTNLSNGVNYAHAASVFVSNSDVYVCGNAIDPSNNANVHAIYWKNGVASWLPDAGANVASAEGIAVSGSNVYIAGLVRQTSGGFGTATLWTNGVASGLPSPVNNYVYVDGLTLSGSDVYVVGYSHDFTFYTVKYWKNGVVTNMPAGPANMETRSGGIAVDGSDVYIAGWERVSATNSKAKYWKNGVGSDLTTGAFNSGADDIKIFGTDVYIGGSEENAAGLGVAKYWKNGVAVNLTDGTHDAYINSIVVK